MAFPRILQTPFTFPWLTATEMHAVLLFPTMKALGRESFPKVADSLCTIAVTISCLIGTIQTAWNLENGRKYDLIFMCFPSE